VINSLELNGSMANSPIPRLGKKYKLLQGALVRCISSSILDNISPVESKARFEGRESPGKRPDKC